MQRWKSPIESHETRTNRPERGDFFIPRSAGLVLADGTTWEGITISGQNDERLQAGQGEVVFTTGMTGYVESLTDPSYAGQILVFTYPLIGNYGVNPKTYESTKIQVSGVVVSQSALHWSHSTAEQSLASWLQAQAVPLLSGVDTRALAKHLRTGGTRNGLITSQIGRTNLPKLARHLPDEFEPVIYRATEKLRVILVDCGAKDGILRSLLSLPVSVKRVPYNYDYTNEDYDGVLLSNGPGDPSDYQATIDIARRALLKGRPMFGICLGSQVMALAAGAKTYKLKFGHRGHNQPCLELGSQRAFITSQNHGYAVDAQSLPDNWRVMFTNLNDGSVEGIAHLTQPFFAVQFHPEACPGPTDTQWLFNKFYKTLEGRQRLKK